MTTGPMMLVAVIGWMCGTVAFAALVRWIGVLFYARNQVLVASGKVDLRRVISLAIAQSVFHAGPYTVATIGLIAYFLRREPWAAWLYGGFGFGFGLMAVMAVRIALAMRRKGATATSPRSP